MSSSNVIMTVCGNPTNKKYWEYIVFSPELSHRLGDQVGKSKKRSWEGRERHCRQLCESFTPITGVRIAVIKSI